MQNDRHNKVQIREVYTDDQRIGGVTVKKLVIILACLLFLAIASFVFIVDPFALNLPPFHKKSVKVDRQVSRIVLDISDMQTIVSVSKKNRVETHVTGKVSVSVRKVDHTIFVQVRRPFFNFGNHERPSRVRILIPKSFHKDFEVRNKSANFYYEGSARHQVFRKVRLNVASGTFYLRDVDTQSFQASLESGRLDLNEIHSPAARFNVRSGRMRVMVFTGAFSSQVDYGLLWVSVEQLTAPLQVGVNYGVTQLNLPGDLGFRLNGKVSKGIIYSDLPLTNSQNANGVVSGVHWFDKYQINANVKGGLLHIY